ncbi:type VI secretion system Vgr family protein [Inquilinus sp. NPDC058860]|uniref:type VI secretion system Vgr family protein n=1 Tax=Inquilinus sp. NPDC058860 TaxID=3346652 RepID=UPI0036795993
MPDMIAMTQAGRLLAIQTPLGDDVFLLEAMAGEEGVCDLFEFRLTVRSKRPDVAAAELVGLPVSWTLELPGGDRRSWSGVVGMVEAGPSLGEGMRSYVLTTHPWLWLFGHTADCRIFQNRTTPQILEEIFGEAGFKDVDFGPVSGPKEVRDYCVQYNETDLAFIRRLLEEEGWAWWFRHEAGPEGGRHVLVVSDGAHGWDEGDEPSLRFTTTNVDLNDVTGWARRFAFTPGRVAESDWNFETPRTDLTTQLPSLAPVEANKPYEIYRWAGRFAKKPRGETVVKRRMEAFETGFETIAAESGNRKVCPGRKFTLYGHPIAAENASYAVMAVRHAAEDSTYVTRGDAGPPSYANSFTAIPSDKPYVPRQETPQPRIDGIQTATVVGPPGEEIHTDSYGRVKVRFPWDRRAKGDDTSSCWLRVSQPWAGRSWGAQTIPRIGMEVLVAYVEGDPDKPTVVGVVPNADRMPPLDLPANKTRTSLRSSSSPGGAGFNELSFEDKAGAEEVFLHAQKDASEMVTNNKLLNIGNAYTAAAQTLHMTTVRDSQSTMTPGDIVLQHKGSMIRMDENGITISFKGKHKVRLSDDGVQIYSDKEVQAKQGQGETNFVSIVSTGVYTNGKDEIMQGVGESGAWIKPEGVYSTGRDEIIHGVGGKSAVCVDPKGVYNAGASQVVHAVGEESAIQITSGDISQNSGKIWLNSPLSQMISQFLGNGQK